jgi:pimeloyl-ACP methyl ester carboxylesterase
MAHRHPTKVERLVLVDGGLPLELGPMADLPVEEITKALIGPALERLRMTFDSPEAYFEFWKPHPALQDNWNERVEAHYRYDLEGNRSSVREEAVLADAGDELTNPDYSQALEALAHPAVLLRAPRGLFNQEPPLYTQAWVAQWPSVESVPVDDVNHYTILFAEHGVKAVADIVRR